MPYILKKKRKLVDDYGPCTAGELTFVIQQSIMAFLRLNPTYADLAEVLGALEGAKADFIRRVLTPYEEQKQAENGDVWSEELQKEMHNA